jgi:hypothetical protein
MELLVIDHLQPLTLKCRDLPLQARNPVILLVYCLDEPVERLSDRLKRARKTFADLNANILGFRFLGELDDVAVAGFLLAPQRLFSQPPRLALDVVAVLPSRRRFSRLRCIARTMSPVMRCACSARAWEMRSSL